MKAKDTVIRQSGILAALESKQGLLSKANAVLGYLSPKIDMIVAEAEARGIQKVVESTKPLLDKIERLVFDIKGDWTDPRHECEKISSLIGEWEREWQAFLKSLEIPE